MKTLCLRIDIEDSTFEKMQEQFGEGQDERYFEDLIENNLSTDLNDGDFQILDIMKGSIVKDDEQDA